MNLILAADKNWAIGKDNNLLTYLPNDLKFFKEKTLGKTVVMGRKTLESLPGKKPLPSRKNIVLTSNESYKVEGAVVVHSYEQLEAALKDCPADDVMVIGGAKVYKDLLPKCDRCYITKIYEQFDADRYFVNLDEMKAFEIVWQSQMQEENGIQYQWMEYRRK